MQKLSEMVQVSRGTQYFPKLIVTEEELKQLYMKGHLTPSWLSQVIDNLDDFPDFFDRMNKLPKEKKRKSLNVTINEFIQTHQNDQEMTADLQSFSKRQLDTIDLMVKYGLHPKQLRKVFTACLSTMDVPTLWKQHKKYVQTKTTQSLYGVAHTSYLDSIQNKKEATMMARYGVKNNMQSPELRDRVIKTMEERHGYKYAFMAKAKDVQDNWYQTLWDTLTMDSNWSTLLQSIATENDWSYNETIFDQDHLHIYHRGFALSNENAKYLDDLLKQYVEMFGAVNYPTDVFFTLPIAHGFSKPMLRHYNELRFTDIQDDILIGGSSKYETLIMNVLESNNINYKWNDHLQLADFELDFYFPDNKIALEINPNITHNSNQYAKQSNRLMYTSTKTRNYHYNKYKLAKEQSITLIQWFSEDLADDKLLSITIPRLLSLLKRYDNKVYARNVIVKKLNQSASKVARHFINNYHSQGNVRASEYWGFYLNNDLVASASFKENKESWELKRLAFPPRVQIIGRLSKLINHFFKEHPDVDVVTSFSDNNLGDRHGYEQARATFVKETRPSLKFVSYSDPSDAYSWAVATKWGVKSRIIAKASNYQHFDNQADIDKYVECDLPHRTDDKCGYDRIYTAGSKKWQFTRKTQ